MIQTRTDQKRGCGWRKPGGLYFVSDSNLFSGCEKLPILLTVCPVCNCGIKPSRGFTWIDTSGLISKQFPPQLCSQDWCKACPLGGLRGRHGLLWVGGAFYPRPEDFVREAVTQGISRRIHQVPRGFEIGKHWILIAHRDAIQKSSDLTIPEYDLGIFYAFKPSAIEYIVKGTETDDELERLEKRGITPVQIVRSGEQQELEPALSEI